MKEYILEIKKILPSSSCEKVISYFDDQQLNLASFGDNQKDRNVRNCETKSILNEPRTFGQKIVRNYLKKIMFDIGTTYRNKFPHYGFDRISQLDILKYEYNNYKAGYEFHVDHGSMVPERSLSISVCLNNKFMGGEFVFDLPEGQAQYAQNIGDAIVFPSNFMFPHQVKKITSGTRYSLIGWII